MLGGRRAPALQLRRIQQHRATIGDHAYTDVSRTIPEQLRLFEALKLPKPAKSAVSCHFALSGYRQISDLRD